MGEDIVEVGTASGILEAEILRGLLESAGIPVCLSHEAATTTYGLGVGPLAEVYLLVPSSRQEEARQLLADYRAGKLADDSEGVG